MVDLRSIHALDHFKRDTASFRRRLRRSGRPEVLTVDGKAELVVQSADSYQRMLDRIDELEAIAGLREGLADARAGRTKPAKVVFRDLRRRFGLARPRAGRAKRA